MKARDISVSTVQISPNELILNIVIRLPGTLAQKDGKVSEKSRKDSQKYFESILKLIDFPHIGSEIKNA